MFLSVCLVQTVDDVLQCDGLHVNDILINHISIFICVLPPSIHLLYLCTGSLHCLIFFVSRSNCCIVQQIPLSVVFHYFNDVLISCAAPVVDGGIQPMDQTPRSRKDVCSSNNWLLFRIVTCKTVQRLFRMWSPPSWNWALFLLSWPLWLLSKGKLPSGI